MVTLRCSRASFERHQSPYQEARIPPRRNPVWESKTRIISPAVSRSVHRVRRGPIARRRRGVASAQRFQGQGGGGRLRRQRPHGELSHRAEICCQKAETDSSNSTISL